MAKIRILIVDDSVVVRRLLSDCLSADPDLEVIGVAANGQIALAKIVQQSPDIVILDIEMPVMDGLQTLVAVRKTHPKLPIIMFSTLTERGACATLEALSRGATDYVTKPSNCGSVNEAIARIRSELTPKIKALCPRAPAQPQTPTPRPRPALATKPRALFKPAKVVVIGVSTGGPNALVSLLSALPKPFPVPILIVQHMPPLFTRMLAERLQAVSGHSVREGFSEALVHRGDVWIASGGEHMEIIRTFHGPGLLTNVNAPENSCRPSVDPLFRSAVRVYGSEVLGVIMTGMGSDGLRGSRAVVEAGGRVIVQDSATSVVWGMPGAVVEAGLADKILPLPALADEIARSVESTPQSISPRVAELAHTL